MFLGRGVPFPELEACLSECGIDGAVLTSTDLRRNDSVLEFISQPTEHRYWLFPWIKPDAEDDLEFVRGSRRYIHGIKLHPSVDRIKITDPMVEPLLAFAAGESLPVMVHCGRWQEMSSYLLVLEAAKRHTGVRFILSHMGGDTPELEMATINAIKESGLRNVYLGTEGVREYWAVQRAVDVIGAEHVIFGSDFPLGHPRMYLGLIDALKISREQKGLLLGGNMLRLIGEVT